MKKILSKKNMVFIGMISFVVIISSGFIVSQKQKQKKIDIKIASKKSSDELMQNRHDANNEIMNNIKSTAVQANYVKIVNGEMEDKNVFVVGEVIAFNKVKKNQYEDKITFGIINKSLQVKGTSEEDQVKLNQSIGAYSAIVSNKDLDVDIKDGEVIKIYGTVKGTDEIGLNLIEVWDIEKAK